MFTLANGTLQVLLFGAFGNAVGAIVKCLSASPDRFIVTFIGQTVVGASQVFILGVPARLAAVWFGPTQVSTACAMGVFGNQLGIALGFLLPPMIVPDTRDTQVIATALLTMFVVSATINCVVFFAVLLCSLQLISSNLATL